MSEFKPDLIVLILIFQLVTDLLDEACGLETKNLNLDLTARNLIDFLLGCTRVIGIIIMVYHGLWVYQMYHFAKLDQPKKSNKNQPKMEQKVSLPEESTKISIENEKLDVKKEIKDKTITEVSPIEPTKESVESQALSMADFDLIRCIGLGSYAKVLMVELKKTRRLYAMKVIKKELVTDDEVRPMRQKPVIFNHCESILTHGLTSSSVTNSFLMTFMA